MQEVFDKNIPVEICPTSNLASCPSAFGSSRNLPHLKEFQRLNHNFIICADDTSKFKTQVQFQPISSSNLCSKNFLYIVLFSTNLSTELFEYAHAFSITVESLKERLVRNVDAIFDESSKEWLRNSILSYRV